MRLRNSNGSPVDPVPFLVAALLATMILIGWGPLYLMAHGIGQPLALGTSATLSVGVCGLLYYRFVWSYNPAIREEVPAATRYLRLLYGIAIGVLVLLALIALLYV